MNRTVENRAISTGVYLFFPTFEVSVADKLFHGHPGLSGLLKQFRWKNIVMVI